MSDYILVFLVILTYGVSGFLLLIGSAVLVNCFWSLKPENILHNRRKNKAYNERNT